MLPTKREPMAEYIDREALLKRLKFKVETDNTYNRLKQRGLESAMAQVRKFPAADVAPVVHGEWIKTTIAEPCGTDELHMTIYRDRETVKCSECGNPSPIYNIEFEFCPRCGARMDGEK